MDYTVEKNNELLFASQDDEILEDGDEKINVNIDDEFMNKVRNAVNYRNLLDYDDSTWELF